MKPKLCHRCGGDLPSGEDLSSFCPHCGAPQLFLSEDYIATGSQPVGSDSTGTLPPPLPRQVDWQTALRCSLGVAAIGAFLCVLSLRIPGISFFSTIWVLTASSITLTLYRRRRPLAWMDAAVGARIGLTTGLALIVFIALSLAIAGLVARFRLHAMGGFDTAFAQMLVQAREAAKQSTASSPPATQQEMLRLYDLPEFQAGIVLASAAISAAFLLLFSAFGGAVNGLLRTRRRARL